MPVYIRADGSENMGLGHLIRCLSLTHMLRPQFGVTFVCRDIPDFFVNELDKSSIRLLKIEREQTFFDRLKRGSMVVLDGYQFDAAYQKTLKNLGSKLVCIDDIYDREFFADLIINHAPGVREEDYNARPQTRFALGPEYALLRPGFLQQARKSENEEPDRLRSRETVLICFGGSDVRNLTGRVLDLVLKMSAFKRIIVVTGAAYTHVLDAKVVKDSRVEHYHGVDEQTMLELMSQAYLAIVPSSGVLFEALAAGCVVISGYYTENQKQNYSGFLNLEAMIGAHTFQDSELAAALHRFEHGQYEVKRNIIDGESRERILRKFIQLAES